MKSNGVNFVLSFILSSFLFLTIRSNLRFLSPPLPDYATTPAWVEIQNDTTLSHPTDDESNIMPMIPSLLTYLMNTTLPGKASIIDPATSDKDSLPPQLLQFVAYYRPTEDNDHQSCPI